MATRAAPCSAALAPGRTFIALGAEGGQLGQFAPQVDVAIDTRNRRATGQRALQVGLGTGQRRFAHISPRHIDMGLHLLVGAATAVQCLHDLQSGQKW